MANTTALDRPSSTPNPPQLAAARTHGATFAAQRAATVPRSVHAYVANLRTADERAVAEAFFAGVLSAPYLVVHAPEADDLVDSAQVCGVAA